MHASAPRLPQSPGSVLIALLVSLYGAAILLLSMRAAMPPLVFALIAAALFVLLTLGARRLRGVGIPIRVSPGAFSLRAFGLGALFCLLSMLLYWAAYFPGGVSSDTLMQWGQAHQFRFDD